MNIFLSVGHSRLKNGNYTSADGRKQNGCLEYTYNKELAAKIKEILEKEGQKVTLCICPEMKFTKSTDEKSYKIPLENNGNYDMAIELHLNASVNHNAEGCEVLYLSEEGKAIAKRIENKLDDIFKGRGITKRENLYFLKSTRSPAVMLETFFCDNANDYKKGKDMDKVALKICEGILDKTITVKDEPKNKTDKLYRVQTGAFSKKENAEKLAAELKKDGYEAIIVECQI